MNLLRLNLILFLIFLLINLSLAQDSISKAEKEAKRILGNIIRFLFSVLMLAASGLLIFLGIKYIIARGGGEEVGKLHQSILYLVVGIVLLILSLFLPNLIRNFVENVTR
jgi:TRAP-type C4-dicarboxylate transport system permease small subunit